jgi:hypothetical protein
MEIPMKSKRQALACLDDLKRRYPSFPFDAILDGIRSKKKGLICPRKLPFGQIDLAVIMHNMWSAVYGPDDDDQKTTAVVPFTGRKMSSRQIKRVYGIKPRPQTAPPSSTTQTTSSSSPGLPPSQPSPLQLPKRPSEIKEEESLETRLPSKPTTSFSYCDDELPALADEEEQDLVSWEKDAHLKRVDLNSKGKT